MEKKMKYKLKKDLPFAIAGTEVQLMPSKLMYPCITYEQNPSYEGVKIWIMDISNLIADGWIEEAKPREWYVLECENPGLLWESEAIKAQLKKNPNLKSIKVREIL